MLSMKQSEIPRNIKPKRYKLSEVLDLFKLNYISEQAKEARSKREHYD